jgi:hypothetical protein
MPMLRAAPNQYLLIGRGGRVENRGSAIQLFVRPGTVHVLVPASKQEAAFEFTQETRDGIPLRFKGIIIYRIVDPVAAARVFDFGNGDSVGRITTLLTHVCLGELRHAVSGMTMTECIEQRKTTLSDVVERSLAATVGPGGAAIGGGGATDGPAGSSGWGIAIEVAQVSQVYIVDTGLRQQLESEVRDRIRLTSERSAVRTKEAVRLAEMATEGRLREQESAADRDALRREEELELARVARQRRMDAEALATERQALELDQDRSRAQAEAERARIDAETPVRLHRLEREAEVLRADSPLLELRRSIREAEVERELMLSRAQQSLRREILPLEQAPRIVEAASGILRGTNLSIYGEDGRLLGQLAPLIGLLTEAVRAAVAGGESPAETSGGGGTPSAAAD